MKIRKLLLIICGSLSLALGTLGIALPLLPTVPLYLLTLFCYTLASMRLRTWFVGTRLYRRYLLPYIEAGGITKKAKALLILFVSIQIFIALLLVHRSIIGIILCAALYLGFILSMCFAVKTVSLNRKTDKQKKE